MNQATGGVPVGTQLNGMYEIDERLAMGGMGEVYIGHNIQTKDKVAIKMILPEHAHNQVILDLFRKEASTLNRLSHEAIVRYHVFSVDPTLDRPYLAMEYAGGPSLVDRLRERPFTDEELDILRHRVASGLHAAHKLGVYHRDISPDNVILVNGEVSRAKIIDFGIAKSTSAEGTLIGGGFAGKLNYVSPEQLGLSGAEVTGKSDIYSLGLVLAEAAIGEPLPMSGTQVEVLDKRRTLPDLARVPARIRPLIEWMLQPDPADRPSDMDEVANWGAPISKPGRASGKARGAAARAGARGGSGEKKRGFPWLLTGVVAAGAAGAAVFVIMQGGEAPGPAPGLPVILTPGTTPTDPLVTAAATLNAGQTGEIIAKPATVDGTFAWVGPAFAYSGDPAELTITLEGDLPAGLEFENGGDATGVIYGIPTEAAAVRLVIKAVGPTGQQASQVVLLTVGASNTPVPAVLDPVTTTSGGDVAEPPVVVGTAPTLRPITPNAGGDAPSLVATGGAGSTGAGGDLPSLSGSGGVSGGAGALSTAPVAAGGGDPAANSAEPVIVGNAPILLSTVPDTGGGAPTLSATGGAGSTGAGSDLPSVSLTGSTSGGASGGTGALSTLPVAAGGADPGASSAEPTIAAGVPLLQPVDLGASGSGAGTGGGTSGSGVAAIGDLPALPKTGRAGTSDPALSTLPVAAGGSDPGANSSEPSVLAGVPLLQPADPGASGGSSGIGTGAGSDLPSLPSTGAGASMGTGLAPQPVASGDGSGGDIGLAAIPPQAENLPPKILEHILVPVDGSHGEEINLRLGTFDDEDGAGSLALRTEGRLPNGMQFIQAAGGIAQLYGRPVESGNFSFEVVAVDPQGLISKFPISLNISAPAAFRGLREYIIGYDGGQCFMSRPLELGERSARIEVFVAEADPLYKFDGDFKADRGFEAQIEGRLITAAQCGLMYALNQVGPNALDNRLQFRIAKDQLTSGETLEGVVEGAPGARVFLYDDQGGVTDLAQYLTATSAGATFKLPLHADGPQVLVAAIADPSSGLGPTAGLEQLLGAARNGTAALALGYIVVSK